MNANITLIITASEPLLAVLQGIFSAGSTATSPTSPTAVTKGTKKKSDDSPAESANEKKVTIEQIVAAVRVKSQTKRQEVKDLVTEFGADRVTNLEPSNYADFWERLQAL